MRCIYCLEDKKEDSFSKVEHVLPQAFGRFENNLTLLRVVCDQCNQFFGDKLELELARDSFEGEARFGHGIKSPKAYKSVGKRSRLTKKVHEGPFKGAYCFLDYSSEFDKVMAMPCPQVGFLKPDGDYEYFLLDSIPTKDSLDQAGFNLKHGKGIRFLGSDPKSATAALEERGITFAFGGYETYSDGNEAADFLTEVQGLIDEVIFRAVAKIGFNYLAYWEGAKFVLDEDFDAIRNLIRWGVKPILPSIAIKDQPILADEPTKGKRRLGHLITVSWAKDRASILSQVSLLNWMTYCVLLAPDFSGERRGITRGHFFNLANHKIEELQVGKKPERTVATPDESE